MSTLSTIQPWWAKYRSVTLKLLVLGMSAIALIWLGYESFRLLWQPERVGNHQVLEGGLDLMLRQWEVSAWFAGQPVYQEIWTASNPPAAQLLLWPFMGWLSVRHAIWLWFVVSIAALAWLIRMTVHECGARTKLERALVALLPLSMYATGATIGNGQLTIPVVALLVASVLRLRREQITWRNDLTAALLMILALSKPSLAAPFFLLTMLVPRRLRPAALVAAGYLAVTLVAMTFQEAGMVATFRGWAGTTAALAVKMAARSVQCNVHALLGTFGWQKWNGLASLSVLILLGAWIHKRRDADIWMLLGITGLATFFWTYHGWYDDLILLPAMVALFRVATTARSPRRDATIAGALFGATLCMTIAPGGRFFLPKPWNHAYTYLQMVVMLVVLVFLLALAARRPYTAAV